VESATDFRYESRRTTASILSNLNTLAITPTTTEFVDIDHRDWNAHWAIQFPEAIECAAGTIRAWPMIQPDWQRVDDATWGYTWRPSAEYAQQVRALNLTAPDRQPQYSRFVEGVELRAEIAARGTEIHLALTIFNTGNQLLREVRCDGGCFQARNEAFRDGGEVARSHIFSGGQFVSMAQLPRSNPIRCWYGHRRPDFEWFWGRTEAVIDRPARLGAVSRDGQRAVVIGYEHATEAMQNADDHHCLHSTPWFGNLLPGQRVKRRGWILFGDDIHKLATELTQRTK